MAGVSINVSEEELRLFSEEAARFERMIVGDCRNLENALSRLSMNMSEDDLFTIRNTVREIVVILEAARPGLTELRKRTETYAELVARLKSKAQEELSPRDRIVRAGAGILYDTVENVAGQSDPTGTVKDAFCDFAEIAVPLALEKGPSLAENMHASYGNPESETFFRTHFLRDESGKPLTAEEAEKSAFPESEEEQKIRAEAGAKEPQEEKKPCI